MQRVETVGSVIRRTGDGPPGQNDSSLRTRNNLRKRFLHSTCPNASCPYSHDASRASLCRAWQQTGHCSKGDNCDFLHRHPSTLQNGEGQAAIVCRSFRETGTCEEGERCPYRHSKAICREYERGFCQKGPECLDLHEQTRPCKDYIYGFCPLGPECPRTQSTNQPQDFLRDGFCVPQVYEQRHQRLALPEMRAVRTQGGRLQEGASLLQLSV